MLDEFIGQEFDWFAIDRVGQIAIFSTAGWGIIPESIGADYTAHQVVSSKFELPGLGSTNVWDDFARYGLYVYDWQVHERAYRKESAPLTTITEELRHRIMSIKNLPEFNLTFNSAFLVNVRP